jgi:predicted glycogen debranching enzyme
VTLRYPRQAEWLEADGLGGFASGTVEDVRTRRYHALLLHAATPPTGRRVLVNGFEAWIEAGDRRAPLSSQCYAPGVVHPDGASCIVGFDADPWPAWSHALADGVRVHHERFVRRGLPVVVLRWNVSGAPAGARLALRPLMSGRDYHALHHANPAFRFDARRVGDAVAWQPYDGVPGVLALANAEYEEAPDWYHHFLYAEEQARGLDATEDLASPGVFRWELDRGEAVLVLAADTPEVRDVLGSAPPLAVAGALGEAELRRRGAFASPLDRAADAYLVTRGSGRTIVAGYPWFTDWGRDTFIAMRGLCLATGRLDDARGILLEWAGAVSEGMLPNLFTDAGPEPEYNSVDASLWYVIVVGEWLAAMAAAGRKVAGRDRRKLETAVEAILDGYSQGTRHGIRADADGLLAAGERGVQLTWMDAKIGDWVVTPRIGKPVEVQALWINALDTGARLAPRWGVLRNRAIASFRGRFWNEERGCLYDVVDEGHEPGRNDGSVRPNQVFAIGGLPVRLLDAKRARRALDTVERLLWTPMGPRSLAPGSPGYAPRYGGGVRERDGAYHQGTVWPWLAGPFVEAWVRARGGTDAAKREARDRFLAPLLRHLHEAGLGHVSEIADADPPHTPNGCPFQAWSVGELLRLDRVVLAEEPTRPRAPDAPPRADHAPAPTSPSTLA